MSNVYTLAVGVSYVIQRTCLFFDHVMFCLLTIFCLCGPYLFVDHVCLLIIFVSYGTHWQNGLAKQNLSNVHFIRMF